MRIENVYYSTYRIPVIHVAIISSSLYKGERLTAIESVGGRHASAFTRYYIIILMQYYRLNIIIESRARVKYLTRLCYQQ